MLMARLSILALLGTYLSPHVRRFYSRFCSVHKAEKHEFCIKMIAIIKAI